jgi:aminopeptidase-like protein
MKIRTKDFYYGVVLNQLAEYPEFTSINKLGKKEGLYQINDNKMILIKYSTAEERWQFTFSSSDFDELKNLEFFIVLVCSGDTICVLDYDELKNVINPKSKSSQQVSLTYSEHEGISVTGSLGELGYKASAGFRP